MPAPSNPFKQALKEGRPQIGLWQALASPYTVEISTGAGYDWLLLDAEHAPNDVPLLLSQLQAMKGSGSHPIIRPPIGETYIIKQLLDIGAQTLLVPMVESRAGLAALDEITSTEGVTAFSSDRPILPPISVISASPVHRGSRPKSKRQSCASAPLARRRAFSPGDLGLAKRYLELGATFVAIGNDLTLLANATTKLLADFQAATPTKALSTAKVY